MSAESISIAPSAVRQEQGAIKALRLDGQRRLSVVNLAPPPQPAPDEVQVAVKAVALNHIDVWGWRGMAFARRTLPIVVGAEAAGVVVKCGRDVADLRPGDIVALYGAHTCGVCRACREGRDNLCERMDNIFGFHIDGFLRERLNIPARLAVKAPSGLDAASAALAPITFGTVEHMLLDNAGLKTGETILVHAAGSGVGSAAIQLAKAIGATVIATAGSDDKVQQALRLGADHAINYTAERFEGRVRKLTNRKGVDVVFEHVGAQTWPGSLLSMGRGARLVTCGSTTGMTAPTNLNLIYQMQLRIQGSFGCRIANMRSAMEKLAHGVVHPVIDSEIGIESFADALARLESRRVFGKILLRL